MFEDKVAIITGSAHGIGRQVAEMLAAGGAKVVVTDIDADAAREAVGQIGRDAVAHSGDITKEGFAESLLATAAEAFGGVDIIVNNAGYIVDSPIHKMSDDDYQAMLDVHLVAPFRIIRAAAPYFREPAKQERAEGREVFRKIVNVTSMAAHGNAGQANYSSAKAGLIGLTKTMAKEWGAFKVNVNAVAFGMVDTRLTAEKTDDSVIHVGDREVKVGIPAQTKSMMGAMIPLGRSATVEEAAGGVVVFCSPWSDYVTGQVLNVSGGLVLGMSS
jgi:3-oxoacyl-[acyl-carrier protein] reductase